MEDSLQEFNAASTNIWTQCKCKDLFFKKRHSTSGPVGDKRLAGPSFERASRRSSASSSSSSIHPCSVDVNRKFQHKRTQNLQRRADVLLHLHPDAALGVPAGRKTARCPECYGFSFAVRGAHLHIRSVPALEQFGQLDGGRLDQRAKHRLHLRLQIHDPLRHPGHRTAFVQINGGNGSKKNTTKKKKFSRALYLPKTATWLAKRRGVARAWRRRTKYWRGNASEDERGGVLFCHFIDLISPVRCIIIQVMHIWNAAEFRISKYYLQKSIKDEAMTGT